MKTLEGLRLFLDTNVIISALENREKNARHVFFNSKALLYSNEYCVKELRRYLEEKRRLAPGEIDQAVAAVRKRVVVLSTPMPDQYSKLELSDKLRHDKPIVKSALDSNLILVTLDRPLLKEAAKYVKSVTPQELAA